MTRRSAAGAVDAIRLLIALSPVPELLAPERESVRSLWSALRPHMLGSGAYVNVLDPQQGRGPADVRAWGERLTAIKAESDPENIFRRNADIRPAAVS